MDVNFLLQADAACAQVLSPQISLKSAPPPATGSIAMMELANAAARASAAQAHDDVPFSPVSSNSNYSVEDRIDHINVPSQSQPPAPSARIHRTPAPTPQPPVTVRHAVHASSSTGRTHLCTSCGETFSLKVRFLHHLLTVHNQQQFDTRTILPCAKCNSAFLRNTDRSKHDLCVHQKLRPFRCDSPNCSSSFFFAKDLSKHRSTVHLRHKPFLCSICPKAFGKREHMTSHIKRVHQKLRPFKCDVCDIRLASKYNLQGHLKTAAHAAAETLAKRDACKVQNTMARSV